MQITYLPLHTRYRYGLEDSFKEEMEEGIIKGFKQKVERKGKRGIKKQSGRLMLLSKPTVGNQAS